MSELTVKIVRTGFFGKWRGNANRDMECLTHKLFDIMLKPITIPVRIYDKCAMAVVKLLSTQSSFVLSMQICLPRPLWQCRKHWTHMKAFGRSQMSAK